jgi:hypothetical protein
MIGDNLSQVQSLQGSLSSASNLVIKAPTGTTSNGAVGLTPNGTTVVSLNVPPSVAVSGNTLHAPAGSALVAQNNVVVLRNLATGANTTIGLPTGIAAVNTPNGVLLVKVTQTPVERGPVKISENESPRPMDRVFTTWNYYSNADGSGIHVNRGVIGFEKTFLDGCASIEVRGSYVDLDGGGISQDGVGDLVGILKFAVLDDPQSGNLLSVGVLATAPTGNAFTAFDGTTIHPALVQGFVGYIVNSGYFYLQGFSSVSTSVDGKESVIVMNDVGLGYYAYLSSSEAIVEFIVPTVEAHVETPVTHTDRNAAYYAFDEVNVTAGVHLGIGPHAVLTVGGTVPLMKPRPFDGELIAQFNLRF